MPLSKALTGELRAILKEEYGADVSEAQASEIGQNFVRYFDQVIKIIHRHDPIPPQQPLPKQRERGPP